MTTPDAYLARIGVDAGGRRPDLPLLAELQAAHLVTVPFENLDVFARRGVRTDVGWSVPKIVERRRGGWCFELNGAFGWLLAELGYAVDYVSCQVAGPDGWGPALDHCALVVHLDGERWFVDVGFGDCCMVPVRLTDGEHDGIPRRVRMRVDGERFVMAECELDGSWVDRLQATWQSHTLDEFTPRSDFLATEPGLAWTTRPFATQAIAADGSRIILRSGVLRIRAGGGEFADREVSDDEFPVLLHEHFGLTP